MTTLNKSGVSVATALGIAAILAVFLLQLARQLLAAGRENVALGIGALFTILAQPSFWVIAGFAFAIVFCVVLLIRN